MSNQTVSVPGVQVTTQDFLVPYSWRCILSTLQDTARRATRTASGTTHAVLTVHIVVDKQGSPIHNTKPKFTRIEPRGSGDALEALLEALAR
jgi:hypothetical protein